MAKLTKSQWRFAAEQLDALCNYSEYDPCRVEVKLLDDSIEVVPAANDANCLYCAEQIVDFCRAFKLTFYISTSPAAYGGRPYARIY